MGRFILTNRKPEIFLLVGTEGRKLFSMEELCYYLYHNLYTIDKSFFDAEFFEFLNRLGEEHLAQKLNMDILGKKHYIQMIKDIFREVGYYSVEEQKDMEQMLTDIMMRTPAENLKVRADAWKEKGENHKAEEGYQQIILDADLQADTKMKADAWNNIGVIRAESFLYAEALQCFQKAMNLWEQQEYLDNIICALIMAGGSITDMDKEKLQKTRKQMAEQYNISEETFDRYAEVIRREEKNISCSQETLEFHEKVSAKDGLGRMEMYETVDEILENWKQEYLYSGGNIS